MACSAEKQKDANNRIRHQSIRCGLVALELYGLDNFVADIDRNREFWRDGSIGTIAHGRAGTGSDAGNGQPYSLEPHIIAAILEWLAGPGFGDLADALDWSWVSASEFRSRHLINGIARLLKG